jgi:hypothetical protein
MDQRKQQMPAFLRLPLTALGRPYNYPPPSWWIWVLLALGFALGWTAHEIGHRMSPPSLRAGLALSSQHPPCAAAVIADITACANADTHANGEHQPLGLIAITTDTARPRRMRMNPKPPKKWNRSRLESEPARNSQTHIAKHESELEKS